MFREKQVGGRRSGENSLKSTQLFLIPGGKRERCRKSNHNGVESGGVATYKYIFAILLHSLLREIAEQRVARKNRIEVSKGCCPKFEKFY